MTGGNEESKIAGYKPAIREPIKYNIPKCKTLILPGPYFTGIGKVISGDMRVISGIGKVISGSVGVTSGDVEDVDFAWLLFKSLRAREPRPYLDKKCYNVQVGAGFPRPASSFPGCKKNRWWI